MAKKYICPTCHHIGKPKYIKPGSGKGELRAWLMFPFGVPYTIWRMLAKTKVCKSCGGFGLIDEDSTVGLRLMAKVDKGTFSAKPFERPYVRNSNESPTSPIPKIRSKDHQF